MTANKWQIGRRILGLRQRDVADRTKMSQARYSLLERGEAVPTAEESERISKALELPDEVLEEVMRAFSLPGDTAG
ncbi:MAG: helix-turn-helix transcriptional regulator [Candidatus Acidiferrum sp.]